MVRMLLEESHDIVRIKAGLALLEKYLDSLQRAFLSARILHVAFTTVCRWAQWP